MKNHFDKAQELIVDIVKNGNMELINSRIETLQERIESRLDTINNWHEKMPSPQEFEAFNRFEVHIWQVELDMLLGRKFKFLK